MKLRRHIRRPVGIFAILLAAGAGPMASAEDEKGMRVDVSPSRFPRPWRRWRKSAMKSVRHQ